MRRGCPKCSGKWFWQLADGRMKCRRCGHRYTFQTVWSACRLPDRLKRKLVEDFVLGVPVYRLRFRRKASLKAMEAFFRDIRAILAVVEKTVPELSGELELDETTFGGRRKGKRGWGAAGKIIVFGILQRDGIVRVFPVSKRRRRTIPPLIRHHTKPGSLYYTDDWHAYGSVAVRGNHVVIRKEKGRPRGRDHMNGIEGFWSYAKHWLYHYRGVPRKFFHLYGSEALRVEDVASRRPGGILL